MNQTCREHLMMFKALLAKMMREFANKVMFVIKVYMRCNDG